MATVVTNLGIAQFASYVKNNPPASFYIGWGTGAGTSAVGDTTLFTEDTTGGYARIACTLTIVTTGPANDTMQFTATQTALGTLTITNMGIFTTATGGILIYKRDFTGVPVAVAGPNTGIAFTEKVQF